MEDTSSTNTKGMHILQKHKMIEVDDSGGKRPSLQAKKSKGDEKRRRSLVRDRRSSRCGLLLFEDETDICRTIPMNIPEENRLQILLHQALKLALNSAYQELPDPDLAFELKSKVEASFATVSEEMFSLEKLGAMVVPANQGAKITTEANLELKESIDSTKAYIERLKKESKDWDSLKEELAIAKVSKKENVTTDAEINERRCLEERLENYAKFDEKLDKSRERLFLQLKTIASSANMLKQFEEQAKEDLNQPTLQLYAETAGKADVRDLLSDIPT